MRIFFEAAHLSPEAVSRDHALFITQRQEASLGSEAVWMQNACVQASVPLLSRVCGLSTPLCAFVSSSVK